MSLVLRNHQLTGIARKIFPVPNTIRNLYLRDEGFYSSYAIVFHSNTGKDFFEKPETAFKIRAQNIIPFKVYVKSGFLRRFAHFKM